MPAPRAPPTRRAAPATRSLDRPVERARRPSRRAPTGPAVRRRRRTAVLVPAAEVVGAWWPPSPGCARWRPGRRSRGSGRRTYRWPRTRSATGLPRLLLRPPRRPLGHGHSRLRPGLRREEWCADLTAWVRLQAGALVTDQVATGDLKSASAGCCLWGVDHGIWHPVGSGYVPQPGDVAVYGLDTHTRVAAHVAVVTGCTPGDRGPDVVNGDGERTGLSVEETGTDQYQADTHGSGAPLSGYGAPNAPPTAGAVVGTGPPPALRPAGCTPRAGRSTSSPRRSPAPRARTPGRSPTP